MTKAPRLEQFSVAYDPRQDRLIWRVRTSDDAEYRFWITRRYLRLLWPILMKMADDFSACKAPHDPLARHALAELAHGRAVDGADFSSRYRDGSLFPLGEEPVLLARITTRPLEANTQRLTVLPEPGQGINLDLDEKLVHLLARLLQEAAVAADWGMALRLTPGEAESASGAPSPSRKLH